MVGMFNFEFLQKEWSFKIDELRADEIIQSPWDDEQGFRSPIYIAVEKL
jgi:hypothetical protein